MTHKNKSRTPGFLKEFMREGRYELQPEQEAKINGMVKEYDNAPKLVLKELDARRDSMGERLTALVGNITDIYVDDELMDKLSKAATLEWVRKSPTALFRIAGKNTKDSNDVHVWVAMVDCEVNREMTRCANSGKPGLSLRAKYMDVISQSYGERLVLEALGITRDEEVDSILTLQHTMFKGASNTQSGMGIDDGITSMSALIRVVENLQHFEASDSRHVM